MVTAVGIRQPVSRKKHAQMRVGHARFSGPIRNERARLCPLKLGQRQTIEELADSAGSTPPGNGREGENRVFGPNGTAKRKPRRARKAEELAELRNWWCAWFLP